MSRKFLTFNNLDDVHAFAAKLPEDALKRFAFQPICGWRQLLDWTFGTTANIRYCGWFSK